MGGGFKEIFDRRGFHHLAAVHDHHTVHRLRHHAEIVGNHNQRHPQLLLQRFNELEDLRLHRHIQSSCRLVSDQQARLAG